MTYYEIVLVAYRAHGQIIGSSSNIITLIMCRISGAYGSQIGRNQITSSKGRLFVRLLTSCLDRARYQTSKDTRTSGYVGHTRKDGYTRNMTASITTSYGPGLFRRVRNTSIETTYARCKESYKGYLGLYIEKRVLTRGGLYGRYKDMFTRRDGL